MIQFDIKAAEPGDTYGEHIETVDTLAQAFRVAADVLDAAATPCTYEVENGIDYSAAVPTLMGDAQIVDDDDNATITIRFYASATLVGLVTITERISS